MDAVMGLVSQNDCKSTADGSRRSCRERASSVRSPSAFAEASGNVGPTDRLAGSEAAVALREHPKGAGGAEATAGLGGAGSGGRDVTGGLEGGALGSGDERSQLPDCAAGRSTRDKYEASLQENR